MPNLLYATDSQTPESLQNELLTSTTRRLGMNLRYEHQSSTRRQKGIEEELSRRIRLMEKIPDSHPTEIFVYNRKGFKSFTSKVKEILGRDLVRKPQKGAVPKYLNCTRDMLKDEIEKGKKAQPVLKEAEKGQEEGDSQLKEEYDQLVEEFGVLESEHEQLREKYRQLRKDHAELQREHERTLHDLSGSKDKGKETKAPEQKAASVPLMRPRDEGIKQAPVLGGKISLPELNTQAREAPKAQETSEQGSAQIPEKEARDQHEAKIRQWEKENFQKEMDKRERELREERAAREHQRMRASPKDSPGAGRLDVKAEGFALQVPHHYMHGALVDSKPTPQTGNLKEWIQGQKNAYPNMKQYLPYQPKPAFLRQANDSKSVSFDLPTKTPNTDQGTTAEQESDPLKQTDAPKSISADLSTGTPAMGRIFPAEQPPAQEPSVQQAPLPQAPDQQPPVQHAPLRPSSIQQSPIQQRSAPLRKANDSKSVPYGHPLIGIPNMDHLYPAQ